MERRADIPPHTLPGSSRSSVAQEYIARSCAATAVVLLILVIVAVHRGQVARTGAGGLDADFRKVNRFFGERANFAAPTKARAQLETLSRTLAELNGSAARDVGLLTATLPNVQRLLQASRNDVDIAHQLVPVAQSLLDAGKSLRGTAADADKTATTIGAEVTKANSEVVELNRVLAEIDGKLAVLPGGSTGTEDKSAFSLAPRPGGR